MPSAPSIACAVSPRQEPDAPAEPTLLERVPSPELRALADRFCATVGQLAGLRSSVLVLTGPGDEPPVVTGAHGLSVARLADQARRLAGPTSLTRALSTGHTVLSRGGALVIVPLTGAAGPIGAVVGQRRRGGAELDAGALTALDTVGQLAAAAIEEHQALLVREEERRRRERLELARSLHDTVVQRLFGAALVMSANGPLSNDERACCAEELRGALADLRSQLVDCAERTAPASSTRLADALRALNDEPGVRVTLTGPPPRLADRQDAVTQSVLAEAVRNARKHAAPSGIEVAVHSGHDLLTLDVVNATSSVPRADHVPGVGLKLAAAEALEADGLLGHGPQGPDRWHVQLTVPQQGAAS